MTTDQLAGDAVDHPGEFEAPFFPGQLAVIHHLEQQIAQLALQVIEVAALDGVGHFVGFFEGVRDDGRVGLLDVPRATVLRIAQTVHQVEQVFKAVHHLSSHHKTLWELACQRCSTSVFSDNRGDCNRWQASSHS